MNKVTILSLLVLLLSHCSNNEANLATYKSLYETAVQNNDIQTAKVALNHLLVLDSTNIAYKDSLARIYINSSNFEAGLRYAEEVYEAGSANDKLKEAMALAYQQVGEIEKAEKFVNTLMEETSNSKYIYQQLVLQYENGNQIKFDSISKQILAQLESDSLMTATLIPMPGPVSGVNQQVPMKAATYFLIGNNALEREQDVNKAVKYLRKSIDEYEQFEMPRYVLMELEKMMRASGRR